MGDRGLVTYRRIGAIPDRSPMGRQRTDPAVPSETVPASLTEVSVRNDHCLARFAPDLWVAGWTPTCRSLSGRGAGRVIPNPLGTPVSGVPPNAGCKAHPAEPRDTPGWLRRGGRGQPSPAGKRVSGPARSGGATRHGPAP